MNEIEEVKKLFTSVKLFSNEVFRTAVLTCLGMSVKAQSGCHMCGNLKSVYRVYKTPLCSRCYDAVYIERLAQFGVEKFHSLVQLLGACVLRREKKRIDEIGRSGKTT